MPIVTNIEAQKKNKNRVNLYVDEEFLMSMHISLMYKLKLKIGSEIDKEKLMDIIKMDDYEKAKFKALNIIGKSEKSEKKITEKLSNEFNTETIEKIISFLKDYSFIDDEKFAKSIVKDNQNSKKLGKNRIKQNLYSKGITENDINIAMSGMDYELEIENAMYLARKRLEKLRGEENRKIKNKLYQHLSYKGFGYDTIQIAISRVLNSDEDY